MLWNRPYPSRSSAFYRERCLDLDPTPCTSSPQWRREECVCAVFGAERLLIVSEARPPFVVRACASSIFKTKGEACLCLASSLINSNCTPLLRPSPCVVCLSPPARLCGAPHRVAIRPTSVRQYTQQNTTYTPFKSVRHAITATPFFQSLFGFLFLSAFIFPPPLPPFACVCVPTTITTAITTATSCSGGAFDRHWANEAF